MTWVVCLVLLGAGCVVLPPRRSVLVARELLRGRSDGADRGLPAVGRGGVDPGVVSAGPGSWLRLVGLWRAGVVRRRNPAAESLETLRFLAALVAALDAGLPTRRAVMVVCGRSTGPLSRAVGQAAAGAQPVGEALAARADQDEIPGLRVVAAAWGLHDRHGVVLAEGLRTAAQLVADDADQRRRVAAAGAGPRATVRLISALPVAGPLAGWCVGLGPFGMYANPLALISLAVGLVAMAAGRLWSRRILASTARPEPAEALTSRVGPC